MNMAWSLSEEQKAFFRGTGIDTEEKRLELLRGRRILFVMGSYPGKRHMYEHARALGIKLTVLDGPGHWTQAAVKEGLFEDFIEVDLYPADTLADRAFAAVQASGKQFDAIATFEDFAGPLTAILARALGLPGHPIMSVAFSRNKIFTREVCVEAYIPSPRFFRIISAADVEEAAEHVGFPAVLKPISGASSTDVYRVDDLGSLHRRYSQVMAAAAGQLKTSAVHSDDENELVWANGFDMTLEEFLDGEEFDVDVLLSEGRIAYSSVNRDLPQPYMVETGAQMPPDFPLDKQDEMIAFAGRVLQALGFANGAFHVEMKYTSHGPRLIEVNARIGGGPLSEMHRRVWGVDLVGQYLLTCLGVPIRPHKAAQPLTNIKVSNLPCPYSGIVTNTDFLESVVNHPQVIRAWPLVKTGQAVRGPDQGVPNWLGMILVCGPSIQDASQTLDLILSQIKMPIAQNTTEASL